ncbi:TonB family protein [Chitinophaga dinghuensis]|uniref:TonB family protein n=1 Tax=Chitinophaga dinghuensis TaxID=1539050 RepID=A0A327W8V1_9BACT|nr:energy transducer TonB [Chitinophaga dinghuensis]RAJ85672.1 TonB family protein [Chitinophaga dinghuensis]
MADKKPHKDQPVSQELIRQYLAGELDDKAMHALERQALDDPFLAEALEGFESSIPDQSANLDELHSRLATRVAPEKGKIRPLYTRIAAAAAILLLLFTGGWFLLKQPVTPSRHPQVAGVPHIPDTAAEKVTEDQANATVTTPAPAAAQPEKPLIAAASPQKTKKVAAEKSVVSREASAEKMNADAAEPAVAFAAPTPKVAAVAKENESIVAGNVLYKAPVNDIQLQKKYADTADKQDFLQGRLAGVEISANAKKRDKALSEVVITGYSPNNAADEDVDVSENNAGPQPVGGYPSFIKYLNDKRMVTDSLIAGNVVRVAFTVLPYGGLESFRIVKGKNIAANEAAINIIKSGPAWLPAKNGQPQEVKVRIAFRMKKQ